VAIVLDPSYAERIIDRARDCHVWVVESALNDPVVAAVWKESREYSLEDGVTAFRASGTPEASFVSILESVVDHHGEYSHDPSLSVIEVVGFQPTIDVRHELVEYGL
jgi:hypothetical protein